jgi:hypothetical protein
LDHVLPRHRSAALAYLELTGVSAVVLQAATTRARVVDLAGVKAGNSYWIENGVLSPLHERKGDEGE